jgi:hypothetical protein
MKHKTQKHWTFGLTEAELEALVDQIKQMPPVFVYESAYVQMQRRLSLKRVTE